MSILFPALFALGCNPPPHTTTSVDTTTTPSALPMVHISPGTLWTEATSRCNYRNYHHISEGFFLSSHEVSQELYQDVMGLNPSQAQLDGQPLLGPELPVQNLSWLDAVRFCNQLSTREGRMPAYQIEGQQVTWDRKADGYRLPTATEWRYAAQADTFPESDADALNGRSLFVTGADSREVCAAANVLTPAAQQALGLSSVIDPFPCEESFLAAAPVGSLSPNPWGLYDMTGNVAEWAWDWHVDYSINLCGSKEQPVHDSPGPTSGKARRIMGGSWRSPPRESSFRSNEGFVPTGWSSLVGFRVARSAPAGGESAARH